MQSTNASPLSWWDMSPEMVREAINQRIANIEAPKPPVQSVVDHMVRYNTRNSPIRIYKSGESQKKMGIEDQDLLIKKP